MGNFRQLVESIIPLKSRAIKLSDDNLDIIQPGGYIYWESRKGDDWAIHKITHRDEFGRWWLNKVSGTAPDLYTPGTLPSANISMYGHYWYCDKDPRALRRFRESLRELKHGRVTTNRDSKYYNIDKDKVKGPRTGVGIERGDDGDFRASAVRKEPGGHRHLKKFPARFADRTQAKDFAHRAAAATGTRYFGSVAVARPKK